MNDQRLGGKVLWAWFVCALCLFLPSGLLAQSDAEIMKNFGAEIMKTAPPEVVNGSPLVKAKYGFTQYCNALAKNKTPVNAGFWNRLQSLTHYGDATRWTCGDHAGLIENLFQGMGIKQNVIHLTADSDSSLPTPNSDHGSMGIEYCGRVYLFDAWQLAVNNNGQYTGADTSKWNGMESTAWEAEMLKQGYIRFGDGTNWHKNTKPIVAKYLTKPGKDLSKLSKPQLEGYIDSMKAEHRLLQEQLVALPPFSDAAGNQIRAEQRALYQEVMRLKKELSTRK